MPKPKKETLEHRKAFELYLSMGKDRSIVAVGQKLGTGKAAVENWSKAFGWQNRIIEREREIADLTSQKVNDTLAEFDAQVVRMSDAVLDLFTENIRDAFDKDGNPERLGWRPKATDAKIFIDLKRERLMKAGGEVEDNGQRIDADALEGLGFEKVQRIVLESVERISRFRKRSNPGSGDV